ncbi:substrate-binding domain-containing protein [Promicromonospora sp. NPDC019610]|uniref:substrate-binding domain-containing protein n=1 Tax=Promicromonospora sp. NPDC019610 TaxID=3364405 RepID=UPI0037A1131A
MTDPNAALVDIGGTDGRVGVGFAVGPRTVVTCHHVLRALPGVVAEGSEIAVTFHADRRSRTARVVVDDADADLAVLRVLRTVRMPDNLTVLRLVEPRVRTQVDVYGYPEARAGGAWNQSVVAGRVGHDRLQLNSTDGVPLQPGFSGGPVIVPGTPNVMGMLVKTTVAGAHSDALAVPSDVIRGLLPPATLLERVGPRLRKLGSGLAGLVRRAWKPAAVGLAVLGVGVPLALWLLGGGVLPGVSGNCVVLDTTVSTEKDELVAELAQDFENSRGVGRRCVDVRVTGLTSGVAAAALADDWQSADAAVTGGDRPDVWLPTSSMSVDQVAAERPEAVPDDDRLGSVTSSVLAIAVPAADRDELFPEGEEDWARLSELSADTAFVLGRDNPHNSSSGLAATVATYYAGMSAAGYAEVLTPEPDWAEVAGLVTDTEVGSFVHGVEQSVQRYGLEATGFMREIYDEGQADGVDGERPLNAVVVQEQLIHLYNCNVPEGGQIEELRCDDPPGLPLTAVYPTEGSLALDHPFVLLEQGDPDVRAAAEDFYAYLREPDAQAKFVELGFRDAAEPASPTAVLEGTLGIRAGQEQDLLPAPPADVLGTMLDTWVGIQRRANVTLVVDVSGSMGDSAGAGGPSKLELAQDAANLGIGMLTPADRLGITVFSDDVRSALPATDQEAAAALPPCAADRTGGCVAADCADTPAPELRACVVDALRADGNTALYGAVTTAFDQAHELHEADRINAVVVLSDGEETKDPDGLDGLLAHLRDPGLNNDDHRVQVYTVAYGADAASATGALEEIAAASGGAFYDATSAEDIGEVMTDVFANFGGDPTRQE